jgi:hypothetical protein
LAALLLPILRSGASGQSAVSMIVDKFGSVYADGGGCETAGARQFH